MVILRSIVFFGLSSLLALFVIDRFGASAAAGSAILTTFFGVGAVGTLAGGWLADRRGKLPVVRLGYLVTAPALGLVLVAPTWPLAVAGAVLLGLGLYLPFAVQTTMGQDYLPNRVGTAAGVTLGLASSVGGAVTPLLGLLADAHGLAWALAVVGVLPVLTFLLSLQLRSTG